MARRPAFDTQWRGGEEQAPRAIFGNVARVVKCLRLKPSRLYRMAMMVRTGLLERLRTALLDTHAEGESWPLQRHADYTQIETANLSCYCSLHFASHTL